MSNPLLAGISSCLFTTLAATCAAADLPATGMNRSPAAADLAFGGLDDVQVLGVDTAADPALRWVTWSEPVDQGSRVKLALVARSKEGLSTVAAAEQAESQEPELRRIPGWRFDRHPILAWTFRHRASGKQVTLFGVDAEGKPMQLAERLGEQISWRVTKKGETLLTIHARPSNRPMEACYRWLEQKQQLAIARCE